MIQSANPAPIDDNRVWHNSMPFTNSHLIYISQCLPSQL